MRAPSGLETADASCRVPESSATIDAARQYEGRGIALPGGRSTPSSGPLLITGVSHHRRFSSQAFLFKRVPLRQVELREFRAASVVTARERREADAALEVAQPGHSDT